MNQTIEARILNAEERLRTAMLNSDVSELDALLSPGLLFTNHLGQLLRKEDDLAAHRSGLLRVLELKPSEQQIRVHGEVAIVSVRMQLSGIYDGNRANGDFRFTRIWALSAEQEWHVIAAHVTTIAPSTA